MPCLRAGKRAEFVSRARSRLSFVQYRSAQPVQGTLCVRDLCRRRCKMGKAERFAKARFRGLARCGPEVVEDPPQAELLGISKRANKYLPKLLIPAACSLLPSSCRTRYAAWALGERIGCRPRFVPFRSPHTTRNPDLPKTRPCRARTCRAGRSIQCASRILRACSRAAVQPAAVVGRRGRRKAGRR